jgi:hypothetical protein
MLIPTSLKDKANSLGYVIDEQLRVFRNDEFKIDFVSIKDAEDWFKWVERNNNDQKGK